MLFRSPIKEISAIPATVGGKTIGARTNGLIKLVNLFSLLANTQASGTPSNAAKVADKAEVQSESLMAVRSFKWVNKLLQGTLLVKAINGATITKIAIPPSTRKRPVNFMVIQNLCSLENAM